MINKINITNLAVVAFFGTASFSRNTLANIRLFFLKRIVESNLTNMQYMNDADPYRR